jgi:hypothetical protein
MNPTLTDNTKNIEQEKPFFGWEEKPDGWLVAPDDFAQSTSFITDEYDWWTEKMRARWDLIEYVKTYMNQKRKKDC